MMTTVRHIELDGDVIAALPKIDLGAHITLRAADGSELALPSEVEDMLLQVLATVVDNEAIRVAPLPELLSSSEAARVLEVSRPTVIRWAEEGFLPCEHHGTHRRFRREDVMEARGERRVQAWRSFNQRREYEKSLRIWE